MIIYSIIISEACKFFEAHPTEDRIKNHELRIVPDRRRKTEEDTEHKYYLPNRTLYNLDTL
jgi:hypothetical protein